MNAKSKKKTKKPEKGLLDKAKNLLDKTDDFMKENVKKFRKSKAFGTATETLKKVEGFMDDASDDYKKSKTKKNIDKAFMKAEKKADKAFKKAEKSYKKVKKLGEKIVRKAETRLNEITGNVKNMPKPNIIKAKVSKPVVPKATKTTAKPIRKAYKQRAVKAPADAIKIATKTTAKPKVAKTPPVKAVKPVKPVKPVEAIKVVKAVKPVEAAPKVARARVKAVKTPVPKADEPKE